MTNAAGWPTRIPARVDDVLVVCAYLIAVLTQNPFPDTDLGWHVAGGLWMLETGKLPTVDPFGAQGSFWLCYSWLAEVVFGFAYRAGGFAGLSALEALLRIAVTASIVRCVRNASRGASPAPGFIQWASEWITIAAAMALILPATRLRPQVISWILFAALITLADRDRLRLRYLAPLTILWVNVHVYWVFVPAVVFLHTCALPRHPSVRNRLHGAWLTAFCATLGLLNPYGWRMFAGLWDLLFNQGTVNELVFELSPMSVRYEPFWLYGGILLLVALCVRRVGANERPAHLATFVLFAAASANQIRYLPLFALSAAPILARSVLPVILGAVMTRIDAFAPRPAAAPAPDTGRRRGVRVVALGLAAWAISAPLVVRSARLPSPHRELFDIAQRLATDPELSRARQVRVLNDANFGGWLELAFWLARPAGATEPLFKPAMDNRGLVVGPERIEEYDQLRQMAGDWPGILSRWGVRVAILPSRAVIIQALGASGGGNGRVGAWDTIYTTGIWTVLVRRDGADPRPG